MLYLPGGSDTQCFGLTAKKSANSFTISKICSSLRPLSGHIQSCLFVQVKAEKPAWYLGAIAGAVLKTLGVVASRSAEYLGYLEKGQLPPARLTLTSFQHTFVLEGTPTPRPPSPLFSLP